MDKVRYAIIGFGGIAENRVAREGFACDASRFSPLRGAVLVGATDMNQGRRGAAEALGLRWYGTGRCLSPCCRQSSFSCALLHSLAAGLAERTTSGLQMW